MKRLHLRLYLYESHQINDIPLYEWILHKAQEIGIEGGTVFRSIASFGETLKIHEEHFFEMWEALTVEVSLVITPDQKESLFQLLKSNNIRAFYLLSEVECGHTMENQ